MSDDNKHFWLSPSKLDRIKACPGSARATEGIHSKSSKAAEEGTYLHAVVAGEIKPKDGELTPEHAELVQECWDYQSLHTAGADEVMLEEHVTLVDEHFQTITEGTADVVALKGDTVILIDWKFGRMYVHAGSLQLRAYAAACMQKYDKAHAEVHIFQPRAGGGKPEMFNDFDVLYNEVKGIRDRAIEPNAMFQAGEHCRFCPIKETCTARLSAQGWLEKEYDGACEALTKRQESVLSDPRTLGALAVESQRIKKICDEILKRTKEMTLLGEPTGFKVVERAGARKITDPQECANRLADVFTQDELMAMITIPLGALEKAYASKLKELDDTPKREAVERLNATIEDIVEQGAPKQVMQKEK